MSLITIGVTTYNRQDYLKDAILSILGQTFVDFEVIIGNDYPESKVTFDTLGVDPDPRIKILNYSKNMGEVANMNYLLNLSKSEWFVWMADDDVFHQSFLELTVKAIEATTIAVFSDFLPRPKLENNFFNKIDNVEIINFSTGSFIREYLLRNIKLIGCYGVAKTSVLKKIGGMPSLGKSFSPYADSLVPILLSTHGSIAFIKSKLCFLRMHSGSISASASDFEAYTSAEADFLDKLSEVRSLLCSHIGYSEIIFNMVNWFRDDEMTVLLRDKSQSKYAVFVQFITHQIEVNYSRIDIKYWPIFTFRNILVIIKTLINKR